MIAHFISIFYYAYLRNEFKIFADAMKLITKIVNKGNPLPSVAWCLSHTTNHHQPRNNGNIFCNTKQFLLSFQWHSYTDPSQIPPILAYNQRNIYVCYFQYLSQYHIWSALTSSGVGHLWISSILSEVERIPVGVTWWPKTVNSDFMNSHFQGWIRRPWSWRCLKII